MKNVFFALAFMLVGTFAFANKEVISESKVNKTENVLSTDSQEELLGCSNKIVTAGFTNDVEKTNIIQLFKTHGVEDVKSV